MKYMIWNTQKKVAWEKYKDFTGYNNRKFRRIIEENINDTNKLNNIMKKELTRVKYLCFGKLKVNTKSKERKKLEKLQTEKVHASEQHDESAVERINKDIATTIKQIQSKNYEKEIRHVENLKGNKGRASAIFWLKDSVLGQKEK